MAQDLTSPARTDTTDHHSTETEIESRPAQDLEPVAYLVESWNGMSDSWETSIRQSPQSISVGSDTIIRSVTPLVALPDVENRR